MPEVKFLAAIFLATGSLLAAEPGLDLAAGIARAEDAVSPVNPYAGDAARATEGRSLFNQYCSHCHAPNAISPDPPKDLRRLQRRYGQRMTEVFHATVTHGRPDKGMPNWTGVLDDQLLWTIFTFLESVQTPP
jgi:mono/diheme cytochrome c family protein